MLGIDRAPVGVDADGPAVEGPDAIDRDALDDPGALLPRDCSHGHGGVDGGGLSVTGEPDPAVDALGVQQWPAIDQFIGVDDFDVDVEAPGHARAPHELLESLGAAGDAYGSDLLEAGRVAHLAFQPVVEVGGVGGQPGHVVGGPQAAHQAGGVPGSAAGERVALEHDDVGPAEFGEVVGDAGTDDATTDDDDLGPIRKL